MNDLKGVKRLILPTSCLPHYNAIAMTQYCHKFNRIYIADCDEELVLVNIVSFFFHRSVLEVLGGHIRYFYVNKL